MSDNPNTDNPNDDLNKQPNGYCGTTSDVQREAEEALRLYNSLQESTASQARRSAVTLAEGMLLMIDIVGSGSPMYITPKAEMVVGRRDPATNTTPDIDLSPHAAYQMGVSRHHVLLRWKDEQLTLLDLDSRNGTFLNSKKTIPNQPYKLHDGDELRLGKMTLRIYFRDKL